jgi:hippurate hydrolase
MVPLLREVIGEDKVHAKPLSMGGEDFARLAREVPGFYFFIGSQDPERLAEARKPGGRPIPPTHSDGYAPVPEPTIKTGVVSMTMAVLGLVGR